MTLTKLDHTELERFKADRKWMSRGNFNQEARFFFNSYKKMRDNEKKLSYYSTL